jgi:hypothetical protein
MWTSSQEIRSLFREKTKRLMKVVGPVALMSLLLGVGWAQDSQEPSATVSGQNSNATDSSQNPDQGQIVPDNQPPSGAQTMTLGATENESNVVNLSLRGEQALDAHKASGKDFVTHGTTFGSAGLSLNRSWNRNVFMARYEGGLVAYNENTLRDIQSLGLSQMLGIGRWIVTVGDEATYSPEALFGFPGHRPAMPNTPSLRTDFVPDQSILTGQQSRVSNTSFAQLEYLLSRRSSFTVTGDYGFLKYVDTGRVGLEHVMGMTGYNYEIRPHETISLMYQYSRFHENFLPGKVEVQSPTIGYTDRIAGRLALQLAAGPEFQKTPFGSHTLFSGSARLVYGWRLTRLEASVSRATMAGAGLSLASNSTLATLELSHEFSRRWSFSVAGGYGDHSLLGQSRNIHSGFGQVELYRRLGRQLGAFVSYAVQRQVSQTICRESVCAGDFSRQTAGIGLEWNRPLFRFR